jgi:copper oxidase (laccase) domain-containing protein
VVAVVTADCVPLTLIAARVRGVAMLHVGWRGAAAGIGEAGLATLRDRFGVRPDEIEAHLGPAICGACYEVGPEVHAALAEPGAPVPSGPQPIDLRARVAERLIRAGVPRERVSVSAHCTRCGESVRLYSHRRGDLGRQVSFAGVRGP